MLWKTINDITKFKNKQQESIKAIVNDENKTITDPVEMANTFNTYFWIGPFTETHRNSPKLTGTNINLIIKTKTFVFKI